MRECLCATCRWWLVAQQLSGLRERANICGLAGETGCKFAIWTEDGFTPTALVTDADFGCVQWEEKGKGGILT